MISSNELKRKSSIWADLLLEKIRAVPPHKAVWGAFILILLELLILLFKDPIFYRDSSEYFACIEAFRLNAWERAFPHHLPVLFTCFAGLLAKIGIPIPSSLLIVSGIFTALTVFPLYGWLKTMLPPSKAAWGVFLYAFFPDIIRCGCAPLIDSGRFFFMTFALWLIFEERPFRHSCMKILLLGLSYAALTLVRAEGICLTAILMAVHVILLFHRGWKAGKMRLVGKVFAGTVLPLLIIVICCMPRMMQMQRICGFPGIDSRQAQGVSRFLTLVFPQKKAITTEKKSESAEICSKNEHCSRSTLREFWDQPRYYGSLFSGLNGWYLPFSLVGLFLLIRYKRFSFAHGMTLLTVFFYCLFHFIIRAGAGRYLLMPGVLSIPFTMEGFCWVMGGLRKRDSRLWIAAGLGILVFLTFQLVRSMKNLNCSGQEEYRSIRKLFQKEGPLFRPLRSQQERPVILLIGQDRSLGIYAGVNVINYSDYPNGLASRINIREAILNGIPGKDVFHWKTQEVPARTAIDVIVTSDDEWCPAGEWEKCVREYRFPGQKYLRVWQILPDAVQKYHGEK